VHDQRRLLPWPDVRHQDRLHLRHLRALQVSRRGGPRRRGPHRFGSALRGLRPRLQDELGLLQRRPVLVRGLAVQGGRRRLHVPQLADSLIEEVRIMKWRRHVTVQ
jgi:hypothetical protein